MKKNNATGNHLTENVPIKHLLLIMRTTLILLFTCVFCSMAEVSYTQDARVTINKRNVILEEVLNEIESQTDYLFIYSNEVNTSEKVSLKAKQEAVSEVLDKLFKDKDVNYSMEGNHIILATIERVNTPEKETIATQIQQQRSVSGKVTDSRGQPLPGATVVVKGTTQGTVTDVDGNYFLTNIPEDATLVFSFVGMQTQEVVVGTQTRIDIRMEEKTIGIDEIVIVGFGTQQKVNVTGSVSSLNSESLEARPVRNVSQALQGLIPGLNLTQSAAGGNLNNEPALNIRGVGTIGQGSRGVPLILIDGMEGDINTLNPLDIENISVLKDAAASSIYGSRAPFGVILITTKKGEEGKLTINYSNNFRWDSPILKPKSMDSYTYALYINDGALNSGQGVMFTEETIQRIIDYQAGRITTTLIPNPSNPQFWCVDFCPNGNTDWYDVTWKDISPSMEHSLEFNGGSKDFNYFFSAHYLHQDGLLELGNDDYKRYNVTAKINSKLTNWLSLDYGVRWGRQDFEEPSWYRKAYDFNSKFHRGRPNIPLYDNNGYLYNPFGDYDFTAGMVDGGQAQEQEDWIYHNFQLTIEPVKEWKIFANLNARINDSFNNWCQQIIYNHDVNGEPVVILPHSKVEEDAARSTFLNPNLYSEYQKNINHHFFKVLLGFQAELFNSRNTQARRDGIIIPELPVLNLTSGTDINGKPLTPYIAGWKDEWATAGYFGRLNYDFGGRYLAELNLRYDGTSRFRSNKRWNWFPSVSLGWNIARESWMRSFEDYITTFKLRGSYGILGNQNTSNLYPTYATMPVGISSGTWLVNGAKPNTASTPALISTSLGWEEVNAYNVGVDMGIIKNKLMGSIDYFERYTNNMVGPARELPVILGTSVPRTNNTDLKTFGFEFDLTWRDQLNNGLKYNIHLLLSDTQTKILHYPNPTGLLSTYREGQMMGEIWGYTTIGIAKTDEEMNNHLASLPNGGQNALGSNWKAGDIMFKDLNGDGKIDKGANTEDDPGDLTIIGNSTPRYLFGLDLVADWKGFDFRAFLQGVLKRDYFQNSFYYWGSGGMVWNQVGLVQHADYFRDDPNHPFGQNLDSFYPRPLFNAKNRQCQTRYLEDASYIRLKNIQLGYTLPLQLTQKASINKLRLYVSGENLWTLTNLIKIFDPETFDGGYGGNAYPLCKTFSIGLMITL